MRLIDADALIPMMKYATTDSDIGVFPIKIGFDAIVKVINAQPTIEPKPHWIPVTERLPENDDEVLVRERCFCRLQSPCEICQEFDCDGCEFKSV